MIEIKRTYHLILFILLSMLLLTEALGQEAKTSPDKDSSKGSSQEKTRSLKTKPRRTVRVAEPKEVPPLEERVAEYRIAVRRGEEREPSSAYLIDEITVTGIYRSVEGFGAFLRSTNKRTFYAYRGMPFYDGSVEQVNSDHVIFQQSLPGGKKKQVVKMYDPNSLRAAALEESEKENDKKDKKKKKEEPKKEEKEEKEEDESDDNE
ncbi:MAG: hypothetical protein JNN15_16100 [Blastocatellia bacterium]|nr:hypothetical protein [Blastocatellia bacterium]